MIGQGIEGFRGRRILLLQGPVGPFFARLATALRHAGATVFKVNLNAGDWWYYRRGALHFRGRPQDWPQWLEARIGERRIDTLLLFGDCRAHHQAARQVAQRLGLEVGVFEEGYLRPDFVTLERFGVNGFSSLLRSMQPLASSAEPPLQPPRPVGPTFRAMAWQGFVYGLATWLGQRAFPHYRHHRPLGLGEALNWLRAGWRKPWYQWRERGWLQRLAGPASGQFFLVPLQVARDAQVVVHAGIDGMASFIHQVAQSFARHAPPGALLVFKHHPLDRGHSDYTALIQQIAADLAIGERTAYLHDQHLPTVLRHARGVVLLNSTVGLSALHHGVPTLACGTALYDLPGLTFQGELDAFWQAAPSARPDQALFERFRDYLIRQTQLNGNFYRPLAGPDAQAGLVWDRRVPDTASGLVPASPPQPRGRAAREIAQP